MKFKLGLLHFIFLIVLILFGILFVLDIFVSAWAGQYLYPSYAMIFSFLFAFLVVVTFNFFLPLFKGFFGVGHRRYSILWILLGVIAAPVNFATNLVGFTAENVLKQECRTIVNDASKGGRRPCEEAIMDYNNLNAAFAVLLVREKELYGGAGPFYKNVKGEKELYFTKENTPQCASLKGVNNYLTKKKGKDDIWAFIRSPFRRRMFSCESLTTGRFTVFQSDVLALETITQKTYQTLTKACGSIANLYSQNHRGKVLASTTFAKLCVNVVARQKAIDSKKITEVANARTLFVETFWDRKFENGYGILLILLTMTFEMGLAILLGVLWQLMKGRRITNEILENVQKDLKAEKILGLLSLVDREKMEKMDILTADKKNLSFPFNDLYREKILRYKKKKEEYKFTVIFEKKRLIQGLKELYRKKIASGEEEKYAEDAKKHQFNPLVFEDAINYVDGFIAFLKAQKIVPHKIKTKFAEIATIFVRQGVIEIKDAQLYAGLKLLMTDYVRAYEKKKYGDRHYTILREFDDDKQTLTITENFLSIIKRVEVFDIFFALEKQTKSATEILKRSVSNLVKKITEEGATREATLSTISAFNKICEKTSSEQLAPFAVDIARMHLEAAKSYSHFGMLREVKGHVSQLQTAVNKTQSAVMKKLQIPYLIEAAIIDANAEADRYNFKQAVGGIEQILTLYYQNINKDFSYYKALSAKGHILQLQGSYSKSITALKQAYGNIVEREKIQAGIHLVKAYALAGKTKEALQLYVEINHALTFHGNRYVRGEKSLEFLRIAGCEIVLSAKRKDQKSIYATLNELPFAFQLSTEVADRYHNIIFRHYKYMIHLLLHKKFSKEIHNFYSRLFVVKKGKTAKQAPIDVTLIHLIKLGMVANYLYQIYASGRNLPKVGPIKKCLVTEEINQQNDIVCTKYQEYRKIMITSDKPFENPDDLKKLLEDSLYLVFVDKF